jgi:hypothetical protein
MKGLRPDFVRVSGPSLVGRVDSRPLFHKEGDERIAVESIVYKDFAAPMRSKTNLEDYLFSYRERGEIPNVIPDLTTGLPLLNAINNLQPVIVGKTNCWHQSQLVLLY